MKPILVLLSVCLFTIPPMDGASQEWQSIFDGKTLAGWSQKGGKATYQVINGEVVGSTVPNTPNSFLCTDKIYGDFELELEFLVHPELNSGIQIRSNSDPDVKNGRVHGYQVEIDPSDRGYSAGIYDESRRGWLQDSADDVSARYAFHQGDWNHLRVLAVGNRIRTWLNGYPITDLSDSMTAEGFIGLQVHGVGGRTDPISVRWRNIRLRENPNPETDEDFIRKLIPKATAMKKADWDSIVRGEPTDSVSHTAILLGSTFTTSTVAQALEFEFLPPVVDPAKLAREINRRPHRTLVHANRITDLHCQVNENAAQGRFRFEVPNLYQGQAYFEAERDNAWEITKIILPALRIQLERKGDDWEKVELPNSIFPADSQIKTLATGFKFTEGPAVGPNGKIYFNDIPNETTHVFDPKSGETQIFRNESGKANGLFWTPANALISCEGGERRISRKTADQVTTLASEFEGKPLNSPNDLVIDSVGGIYFTDPRYGNRDNMELDIEGVYYLPRGSKTPQRVIDDFVRPNGIIFSPDFKTLYVADHGDQKTWAYDVDGPGKLSNKRILALAGSDGMSIDTTGNVYLTWQGSIQVYAPLKSAIQKDGEKVYGKKVGELKFPQAPANCLLVGNTLFVTARTGFYSVQLNRTGIR